MKKFLRNFLVITLVIVIAAIVLTHSSKARHAVAPQGMKFPQGVSEEDD